MVSSSPVELDDRARWSAPSFAFALDRYRFRLKALIEALLLSPLVRSPFHGRARFPHPGSPVGLVRSYTSSSSATCSGPAVRAAQRLCLAAQSRSALELAAASLGAPPHGSCSPSRCRFYCRAWSAAGCLPPFCRSTNSPPRCSSPRNDADAAGRDVQLRARICRSFDGGAVGHVYRRHRHSPHLCQCISRPRQDTQCRNKAADMDGDASKPRRTKPRHRRAFQGVTKRFGEVTALHEISLAIRRGEFMTLLGPSGCGKTTVLNLARGSSARTAEKS